MLEIAPPSDRDTSAHVDTAVAAIEDDDIPNILSCDFFKFRFLQLQFCNVVYFLQGRLGAVNCAENFECMFGYLVLLDTCVGCMNSE